MVSILPPKRNMFSGIAEAMSEFGRNAPQLLEERYQTQRGLGAITDLQNELALAGGDMTKVLPAVAKAVSLNPNLQKSGYVEHALRMAQALNANKADLPSDIEGGGFQTPQRQNLPGFLNPSNHEQKGAQFFPSVTPPTGEVGNVPQEATTGKKLPLLSPDQYATAARQLAKSQTDNGIPTTPLQAMELIKQNEENKKAHNEQVDIELAQRVAGQEKYGEKAVNYLKKSFGNANIPPELEAYFEKKGEEISKTGKSEAEKNRYLSEEAKNFANAVSNIKKSSTAPRLHKNLLRGFEGTYKNFEDSAKDLRQLMKPILDAQLYDYGRGLLSDLGYYPEEREIIVNPLSERSKGILNNIVAIPKIEKPESLGLPGVRARKDPNAGDINEVKKALIELKKTEPNFSLPLTRKYFEDKNYGWRTFKNALNELQEEGFQLEDDQRNQMEILDSPALSQLEEILHSLNLIGR